jgi:hypothetical protein
MYVGQVLFAGSKDVNIAKITDDMILQQNVDYFGDFKVL